MMKLKSISLCLLFSAAICALSPRAFAQSTLGATTTKAPQHSWATNAIIYEANLRQGNPERTIKGLQKQLPRLRNLGVDIVWLMPIHPISQKNRKGSLGSYYAVQDYKAVNPEFGTIDDLREFVRTAHHHGIRVIIDEVCNHSGCDNIWVESNPDFYARNEKGEMYGPYDWTDTYKFDYSNPAMRAAMLDALEFWVKEADIDGYRFDVAGEVPTDFWVDARKRIEKIKPVLFLAESSKPELLAEAFDMDYAWPMKDTFQAIAATQGVNQRAIAKKQKLPRKSGADIFRLIEQQKKQYPKGAINMQMITNHDLNSWDGTEFERFGPATAAFAVLSYTLPGVPMLYNGQEVGFNKALEFFEHDATPDYTPNEFTTFYQMLNALRHSNSAFNAGRDNQGSFTPIPTASNDIVAFERKNGNDRAIVIANLSNADVKLNFKGKNPDLKGLTNLFNPVADSLPSGLKPWQYLVFTTPVGK